MLGEHGVDFVVVGGVAVQAHGYIRWNQGPGRIVRPPTTLNLSRLGEALAELEAELQGSARSSSPILTSASARRSSRSSRTAGHSTWSTVEHVAGAPRSYDGSCGIGALESSCRDRWPWRA